MATLRERILTRMLAPYGITAGEALEDAGIARGCYPKVQRDGVRLFTGPPLMGSEPGGITGRAGRLIPHDDMRGMVADAIASWLPFVLRAMRTASLRRHGYGPGLSPTWSILVNPVVLAAATATGIPAARLATMRREGGKPVFPGLHDDGYEVHPDTACYVRDHSHHEGADYLRGRFLGDRSEHLVDHALQLLEDTRFPIRSVSDQGGRHTMIELRRLLPETTCAALAGRPLSDALDLPGFESGTAAGSVPIAEAAPGPDNGRTTLHVERRRVPATPPPADADMRWAIAWTKVDTVP